MEQGPPDAIFGLVEAHKKDTRPNKVSLAIGAYRDSENKPLVLPTVRKVGIGTTVQVTWPHNSDHVIMVPAGREDLNGQKPGQGVCWDDGIRDLHS